MDARQVRTKEEAKCIVEERGLSHVKLGVTDIDGIMRGKYVTRDKFFSALEKGIELLRRGARLGLERPAL